MHRRTEPAPIAPRDSQSEARVGSRVDGGEWYLSELLYVWEAAQEEARSAYTAWNETLGTAGYCVYRAAQDRADAAQDALAAACTRLGHWTVT